MRPCFILLFSNVHSRYLCVCGQSEAQELKKEVEETMLQRQVQMSEEKVIFLKHKADMHMQQINAKHLIAKESRDNIAKRHKTEKEDRKAELAARNEQAVSTMGYYGSNMVDFFYYYFIFIVHVQKCKNMSFLSF